MSRLGDQHYSGQMQSLLQTSWLDASAAEASLAFVSPSLPKLVSLHEKALNLHLQMKKSEARGSAFFESSLLLYLGIHRFGAEALNCTAHAVIHNNRTSGKDNKATQGLVSNAIGYLESLFATERAAEQVKWRGHSWARMAHDLA